MVHGPHRSRVMPMENVDRPLMVQLPEVAEAVAEVLGLAAGQLREGGLHGGRAHARPHVTHEIDGLVAVLDMAAMTRTAQGPGLPGHPHASDVPRRPRCRAPSQAARPPHAAAPLAAWPSARRPRHARGRHARLHAGAAGRASHASGVGRCKDSWVGVIRVLL